jgi:hypothetical protein
MASSSFSGQTSGAASFGTDSGSPGSRPRTAFQKGV